MAVFGCLLATGHALAANPTTLTVGGTNVLNGGYWTTDAESGTLTEASADNYNVYYDGSGTLTLKDATINGTNTTGHVGAGIYAEGDLTIVLEGTSTVTGVQDPNGESQSIRVSGNLTIQGGGSLNAQGAGTSEGDSYGIFVTESFTQQGGSVTAIGGNVSANQTSEGLYVGSTVTVQSGTLTATGGNTSGNSYGISASGTVTVNDAIVTATGGTGKKSYGLYIDSSSPSVTLSGGSLTARSGSATSEAGGIYVLNPFGSAGSVTVGDNSTLLANSVILYVYDDISWSWTEKPLAPTGYGSWLIYGQSNQTSAVGGSYTLEEKYHHPGRCYPHHPGGQHPDDSGGRHADRGGHPQQRGHAVHRRRNLPDRQRQPGGQRQLYRHRRRRSDGHRGTRGRDLCQLSGDGRPGRPHGARPCLRRQCRRLDAYL